MVERFDFKKMSITPAVSNPLHRVWRHFPRRTDGDGQLNPGNTQYAIPVGVEGTGVNRLINVAKFVVRYLPPPEVRWQSRTRALESRHYGDVVFCENSGSWGDLRR